MRPRVVVTLTAAGLEQERANLERGSVVGAGVAGLERGAFCDVELAFPSGQRLLVPARAVLATADGTVFAFEPSDREALRRLLEAPPPAVAGDPRLSALSKMAREELERLNDDIQNMLDHDFKTESASGAFGQRYEDYKRQADSMNETLSGLGNELDQIIEGFRSTDQSASGH